MRLPPWRCKDCRKWFSFWHCYTEEGMFCMHHGDWRRMVTGEVWWPFQELGRAYRKIWKWFWTDDLHEQ